MEELYNVIIIWVLGIITGMILHSAAGHTIGDWLKEHFHFHDKKEKKE